MMAQLHGWWQGLTGREQRLLGVGGGLLLLGLGYWMLWQPLGARLAEGERQVLSQQQTLAWLKEQGQQVLALQAGSGQQIDRSGTLEGVVNRTAFSHKIKIARLQPQGEELQVWIDTVPFDELLLWLGTLTQQYGVEIQIIEVARENLAPGLVKVRRLQLSRP